MTTRDFGEAGHKLLRQPVRVGLIGCGQWGVNVANAAARCPVLDLCAVADADMSRSTSLAADLGNVPQVVSSADLIADEDVHAVLIVTDAVTHYAMAMDALDAGKHVFVEKPLALTSTDCVRLALRAHSAGRALMVGHTFMYSDYVESVDRALASDELGRVRYMHLQRLAYGRFRSDVNVTWNLGPHDVSILNHWAGELPEAVRCVEYAFARPDLADVAQITLDFGSFLGHIQLSCVDPQKVRRATVAGTKAGIVYDDVEGTVALCENGTSSTRTLRNAADNRPLDVEIAHFAECVMTGMTPKTDGMHAAGVVAVLEAAAISAANGGAWIRPNMPTSDPWAVQHQPEHAAEAVTDLCSTSSPESRR
ncbi:Gfo/Idh/MocA family protein [Actinospica robiniae]|uniref:Gfo/Idh/MocA family protein n=1 Tax=Actinospica robiniae TaxID=304901 RepID=UPI000A011B60|nr:Gfo/Idh/MocA family oxidoreductase [Actinospica robiniae]